MPKLVFEYSHRIFEYIRIFEWYTHLCPIDPLRWLTWWYMYWKYEVHVYAWYRIWALSMAPCKKINKLDNLEVFINDESLGFCLRKQRDTTIVQPRLSKFCMHVVDIRHQECFGSIVIVWPTCTLWKVCCDCVILKKLNCQSIQPS